MTSCVDRLIREFKAAISQMLVTWKFTQYTNHRLPPYCAARGRWNADEQMVRDAGFDPDDWHTTVHILRDNWGAHLAGALIVTEIPYRERFCVVEVDSYEILRYHRSSN